MRLSEGMPSENTLRDYSTILLGLLQFFRATAYVFSSVRSPSQKLVAL